MSTTADYAGARYNLRVVRGDDVVETFAMTGSDGLPKNLANYTFRSQVRDAPAPEGNLIGSFVCSKDSVAGTVTRTLSKTITADMEEGSYYHDLEWSDPNGLVRTLLSGKLQIVPEVTV